MKTYTSTNARKKFSEMYNSVRYSGKPVAIKHHGSDPVIMIREKDIYPEPTTKELFNVASKSGAFTDDPKIDYA